jgi:glycosyltransferase involved in cell wall biosynthesis
MKSIVVFHPSNDLYGADRILINALRSFPEDSKKVVYMPKEGPLTKLILESVENSKVLIEPRLPIIFRAIFTPKGIIQFARNYSSFKRFLKREKKKHGFDLAYVNTLSCSFLLPIMSRLKIKSFVHVHEILESPKIIAWATAKLASKYSNYIICVSKAVENNLIRIIPEIEEKSHCLHNGILPIASKETQENERLTFYLFGRIMPKKGQWYLLDALSKVSENTLKKAHFVIVGGPPPGREHLSESLKDKIKETKLEPFVTLKGFCSDISFEMSKADVCIVPSLMRDPFPTTVLEAMSSGKPVIATNHGGAVEVIENNVNGFLISPDNSKQFAEVIETVVRDKFNVPAMGKRAKKIFDDGFTLARFQGDWKTLHFNQA